MPKHSNEQERKFFTRQEIAKKFGVCPHTVDRWKIRHSKIGKVVLYDIKDVEDFVYSKAVDISTEQKGA